MRRRLIKLQSGQTGICHEALTEISSAQSQDVDHCEDILERSQLQLVELSMISSRMSLIRVFVSTLNIRLYIQVTWHSLESTSVQ